MSDNQDVDTTDYVCSECRRELKIKVDSREEIHCKYCGCPILYKIRKEGMNQILAR